MDALLAAAAAAPGNLIKNIATITPATATGDLTPTEVTDAIGFTVDSCYLMGFGGSTTAEKINDYPVTLTANFPALNSMENPDINYVLTITPSEYLAINNPADNIRFMVDNKEIVVTGSNATVDTNGVLTLTIPHTQDMKNKTLYIMIPAKTAPDFETADLSGLVPENQLTSAATLNISDATTNTPICTAQNFTITTNIEANIPNISGALKKVN